MPQNRRNTTGFNPLGVSLHSISYDFRSQIGTATVEGSPDGNETIQFFRTIDPEVRIIHVIDPGRSAAYFLRNGQWCCFDNVGHSLPQWVTESADPSTAEDLDAWMESRLREDIEALPEPPTRGGPILWASPATVKNFPR